MPYDWKCLPALKGQLSTLRLLEGTTVEQMCVQMWIQAAIFFVPGLIQKLQKKCKDINTRPSTKVTTKVQKNNAAMRQCHTERHVREGEAAGREHRARSVPLSCTHARLDSLALCTRRPAPTGTAYVGSGSAPLARPVLRRLADAVDD